MSLEGGLIVSTQIEIRAFGERIAYKQSGDDFRTAGSGGMPWGVPPAALGLLAGLGLLGLLAALAKQGALVLVIQRPGYAGVSAVLVVALVLGPVPGVRVSRAGGGGEASFYWELTDPLGTGMVMLDETGARRVHRTYSPFGVEHASAGSGDWLPRHFAGHLEDEDSGLVYMQARWMDPQSGTSLSVDPVVADSADPQSYNAYSYARNNPVSFADPTGTCPAGLFGGSCLILFLGRPEGDGHSGPGPSAAPNDTVGNFLSGLLNLGGGGTPQSQSQGAALATLGGTIFLSPEPISKPVAIIMGAVGVGILVWPFVGEPLTRGVQILQQSGEGDHAGKEDRNPAQDKPLSKGEIKALEDGKVDVHDLKGGKQTGQSDLYKDKQGNIYVKPKGGVGPGEPTGLNIKDFM